MSELCQFDGRSVAVDYTVPNTLNLKQRTPGVKYAPLEVQTAAQNLKISKYANLAGNKNHEFVPLVAFFFFFFFFFF